MERRCWYREMVTDKVRESETVSRGRRRGRENQEREDDITYHSSAWECRTISYTSISFHLSKVGHKTRLECRDTQEDKGIENRSSTAI